MKLVECVPNISEGRDGQAIAAIVEAAASVSGVAILHVDTNADANRTVITMAGEGEAVCNAALEMTLMAAKKIDMRKHKGVHPRIGAVDVCPFVPLSGATIDYCVELSKKFAQQAATQLSIPVFLYENSATNESRRSLSEIRKGEYEGLKQKLRSPHWQPDFGPSVFNPTFGALVTGARPFLVAFNVNVKNLSIESAKRIAARIRTSGRWVNSSVGESQHIPGLLPACKAIGWSYPQQQVVQVSTNITDYTQNGMHDIYEACRKFAVEFGGDVAGSEMIGLVPREALLQAGRFYAPEKTSDADLIAAAIEHLGLNSLAPFDVQGRVIEEQLGRLY